MYLEKGLSQTTRIGLPVRDFFFLLTLCISVFWCILLGTIFERTLSPDSMSFLQASESFQGDGSPLPIDRQPFFPILLSLLLNPTRDFLLLNQVLFIFTCLLSYLIMKKLVRRKVAFYLNLLLVFNPLLGPSTFFLLSETLTLFLVVLNLQIVSNMMLKKSRLIHVVSLSVILSIMYQTKVTVFIFCVCLSFLVFLVSESFRLTRLLVLIISLAFLTVGISSVISKHSNEIHSSLDVGQRGLTVGVLMHYIDYLPASHNKEFSLIFSQLKLQIERDEPGSRFWVFQRSIGEYKKLYPNVEVEDTLNSLVREMVLRFPFVLAQSVITSYAKNSLVDSSSFIPTFKSDSMLLRIHQLIYSLWSLMQFLFISFTFWYLLAIWFIDRRNINNRKNLLYSLSVVFSVHLFLLINSIGSPVEQARYALPIAPIVIFLLPILGQLKRNSGFVYFRR